VQKLQLIQGVQRAGFRLQDLKELMPDDSPSEAKRADIVLRLERRIAQIEELQALMDQSKAELRAVIATIQAHPQGTLCTQAQDKVWASIEAHKKTPRI